MRIVAMCLFTLVAAGVAGAAGPPATTDKDTAKTVRIVFFAGTPSHGFGCHEHNAGVRLLARWLEDALPKQTGGARVETTLCFNRAWCSADTLAAADTIVVFSDGDGAHPFHTHFDELERLQQQGKGFVVLHYATVLPTGREGNLLLNATGGYYEHHWSVNPFFTGEFRDIPSHEITCGVKPFAIYDEWYFHMRFLQPPGDRRVTPILTCIPPDQAKSGPDGVYSGNPTVRARLGLPEHVAWAIERADGGRGFGFTGGDYHWNWAHPSFRKIVINAIAWTSHIAIPTDGINVQTPTLAELLEHQDEPNNLTPERTAEIQKMIDAWQ